MVIGVQAISRLASGSVDLCLLKFRRNGTHHARSDLVLQIEDVVETTIKALCPQMHSGRGVDKLPGNPDAAACLAYAPFENVTDPQLLPDLLHVYGSPFVRKTRVPRDNEEAAKARQRSNNLLDHPIGEVLLLAVAT